MATIELKDIRKTFPPNVTALNDVNINVGSGEFFTLLGPSGCGKTTLLRTIAGFNQQDRGTVVVDGNPIDHVPAYRRDTGMVFQDYAIFPHMSVADNVAFGLRNRSVPKTEIQDRVGEALVMARLDGFGERMPSQLSGGQQQRVGLARAMVIRPKVLLMDEPLSNLDAKLRIELREDIRALQRGLGITTVYVTHDQEEALVISDRICVMFDGVVHQIGSPWEIYRIPHSRFVAGFVGTMNFLSGQIENSGREIQLALGGQRIAWPNSAEAHGNVVVAIRPEDVGLEKPDATKSGFTLAGRITRTSFTGRDVQYGVTCADESQIEVHIANPPGDRINQNGMEVGLHLPVSRLVLFDPATGARL